MFTERFNKILNILGIDNDYQFSEYAECDRSYINRLKGGKRIPVPNGKAAKRIILGIYMCAKQKNKLKSLCNVVGVNCDASDEIILESVSRYLFEGYETKKRVRKKNSEGIKKYHHNAKFAGRINDVMELTEMSNARLAKLVNLDASVISRYRRGLSFPKKNSEISEIMCRVLFEHIVAQNRLSRLCDLMNVEAEFFENKEMGVTLFQNWIYDFFDGEAELVKSLIEDLDNFSPDIVFPLMDVKNCINEENSGTSQFYQGNEGLRKAVLRLLSGAIRDDVKELWLYSDCNTDWMTEDSEFTIRWMALMSACVRSGMTIRIIHNIDRRLEEMISAIQNWMPLYMSGSIDSYYHVRLNGERFSHTIFIARGSGCINSCYVTGQNESARYIYDTSEEMLHYHESMYEALLENCRPLIFIRQTAAEWKRYVIQEKENKISVISNTLSLDTMPQETFDSIMHRIELSEENKDKLYEEWKQHRKLFENYLLNGNIIEYIPLHLWKDMAHEEKMMIDDVFADTTVVQIAYTAQEYQHHMQYMRELAEKYSKYKICFLENIPFSKIKIIIKQKSVIIRRLQVPFIDFEVTHPLIIQAFNAYLDKLRNI